MKLRTLLSFDLGLLALVVLASRLALFAHEAGGHALPALALGAERVEVRMSALGGGYVKYRLPSTPSPGQVFVLKLGGIAINLLSGAAAWFLARRLSSRGVLHLGLLVFGVGSVGGSVVYLANGLYYGSGDPVGFAPRTLDISALRPLWLLGLPAGAAVAWFGARHWSDVLGRHATPRGRGGRIGWTLATLGAAGAAYLGLWLLLRDGSVEGSTRQWRLQQEIAKEAERRAPPPSEAPRPPAPVVVRAEEVAHRVPAPWGPIALYAAGLLAGTLSLLRPWRGGAAEEDWPLRPSALAAAAAAVTVALLCAFG